MRRSWVVTISVLAALLVFLAVLLATKNYRSTIVFLVVPQNTKAALHLEGALGNAVFLAEGESFAKRVSRTLPQRIRGTWNSEISASWQEDTSILEFAVSSKRAQDAHTAGKSLKKAFLSHFSSLYDVKRDFHVRIVSDVKTVHAGRNVLLAIIVGILAGALAAFFSVVFVRNAERFSLKNQSQEGKTMVERELERKSPAQKELPKRTESVHESTEEKILDPSEMKENQKTASVPENLPIVGLRGETTAGELRKNISAEEKKETSDKRPKESDREPTDEELKERLNKLLQGDL